MYYNDRLHWTISGLLTTALTTYAAETAAMTTNTSHHNTVNKISRERPQDRDSVLVCHVKLQFHECKTNFYVARLQKIGARKVFLVELRRTSCRKRRQSISKNTIVYPTTTAKLGWPGTENRIGSQWPGNCSHSCQQIISIIINVVVVTVVSRQGSVHHTRLYSLRFSCSIVSFTAANTKRMFSVSAEKQHHSQTKQQ